MKIFIDNEDEAHQRIVSIKDSKVETIYEYIDVMIDALQGSGFHEEAIKLALLDKCCEYGLIKENPNEDIL